MRIFLVILFAVFILQQPVSASIDGDFGYDMEITILEKGTDNIVFVHQGTPISVPYTAYFNGGSLTIHDYDWNEGSKLSLDMDVETYKNRRITESSPDEDAKYSTEHFDVVVSVTPQLISHGLIIY